MTDQQQALLNYYQDLSVQDQYSLLRYAEFLSTGVVSNESVAGDFVKDSSTSSQDERPSSRQVVAKPEKIERPEDETVVAALKRMSATYPMLEKNKLLNKASELVAQHIMFGKPAVVVIKDIEAMFAEAYDKFVEDFGRDK
ncbi:hypothetical protein MNBD_GAMMA21-2686 [hydrothermal vent metagenome]|uniref:Uncharacterized protein n=1 Tax=hydrothermal vent metagenome TaxID=652676 RepID=A0A3B1B919_9ZZZZ